jgi:uncharacterized protein
MPQDLYQYEKMIDRALRGVVREALERAAREGLRGSHHFYVGFATDIKGVSIPDSLRERYPQEMTIVLQHQFWDLEVGEDGFSVTLSFQKQPERLTVPFAAVRSFADPSVNFALEFASPERPEAALSSASPGVPAPTVLPGPTSAPTVVPAPIAPQIKAIETDSGKAQENAPEKTGAEVVTLDSFRKR